MIQRVVGLVIAVIAAIFSVHAPVVAGAAPPASGVCGYYGVRCTADANGTATERGPPADEYDPITTYATVVPVRVVLQRA